MSTFSATTLAIPDSVLRTRAGLPKSRYFLDDKLRCLDPRSGLNETWARARTFLGLFVFWVTNGIVTKRDKGPSSWTAYRGVLGEDQIIDHLLADRIPGRRPIWYGSRSAERSCYLCLDVDADDTAEKLLAKKYDLAAMPEDMQAVELRKIRTTLTLAPNKPSFIDRCESVERAFRRMGINPENPRSVLILQSPSGGRHYYVFLDAPYFLTQIHELLQSADLRHVKGQIEFFPSTSHGLRLPFGYIPGQPHDPQAWIQFIDDYDNGRIIRHALADLQENLDKHHATQHRRIESRKNLPAKAQPTTPGTTHFGIPRRLQRTETKPAPATVPQDRYMQLLEGVHSQADAEELLALGIQVSGTRTQVLNHLAAHLVWFRHMSPEDAAGFLTDWAMTPRHNSKDIAEDLARGTNQVAKQIEGMCNWYARQKATDTPPGTQRKFLFAQEELDSLSSGLVRLAPDDRIPQAHFLLHFLRFAKLYGTRDKSGNGWQAAPAIRQVIRRWPGCHHMNYKTRIHHAISEGIMGVVKEAWHHQGGKGRARTYRLAIPVVSETEWEMTYDEAFESLAVDAPKPESRSAQLPPTGEESSNANTSGRIESGTAAVTSYRGPLPPSLCPSSPGAGLDSGPHQCPSLPHAAPGLSGEDSGGMSAFSTVSRAWLTSKTFHGSSREHAKALPGTYG